MGNIRAGPLFAALFLASMMLISGLTFGASQVHSGIQKARCETALIAADSGRDTPIREIDGDSSGEYCQAPALAPIIVAITVTASSRTEIADSRYQDPVEHATAPPNLEAIPPTFDYMSTYTRAGKGSVICATVIRRPTGPSEVLRLHRLLSRSDWD